MPGLLVHDCPQVSVGPQAIPSRLKRFRSVFLCSSSFLIVLMGIDSFAGHSSKVNERPVADSREAPVARLGGEVVVTPGANLG